VLEFIIFCGARLGNYFILFLKSRVELSSSSATGEFFEPWVPSVAQETVYRRVVEIDIGRRGEALAKFLFCFFDKQFITTKFVTTASSPGQDCLVVAGDGRESISVSSFQE
jgi:hypothetical protein